MRKLNLSRSYISPFFIQVLYLCAEGHYQLGERLLSGEEPDQGTKKILNEIILRPGKVKDYDDDDELTRYIY